MIVDLKTRLRSRRSSIESCEIKDFLPLIKQFFAFLDSNPVLKAVVGELLARNQKSVREVQNAKPNSRIYGVTSEEAAAIGYLKCQLFAAQDDIYKFHATEFGGYGEFDETLQQYKDWYVKPLFNYLDETLDDADTLLATLIRYKQKVEWYRKNEVLQRYRDDISRGEKNLKRHMFEFLFDQGVVFHIEPTSASGEPDVVFLDDANRPFAGEVKVFDPESGKTTSDVKKGFSQTYRYCQDYNKPLGYLIVFNASKKQLNVQIPSKPDGIPRFELNHKTIFLVVINLYDNGTASTLGIAETVTIQESELISEIQESTQAKS